jgi:fumarylacetoacetase
MTVAKTNPTHDPHLRSWVESANSNASDFPIQNLPFCVFRRRGTREIPRIGVAIGDAVLDLRRAGEGDLLAGVPQVAAEACQASRLNALMSLGPDAAGAIRNRLIDMLQHKAPRREDLLVDMSGAEFLLPADIGDYTDFYASVFHATNVGRLFRPDAPLPANYRHVPIAYHGRSSSIVISGTPVRRPCGQRKQPDEASPEFGPSARLDYEVELAAFIGMGNEHGARIRLDTAERHVFGLCLLNDWSARDIQVWEYQPLGPFLAKNFATSISPWVVTWEALAPFRCRAFARPPGDPSPLPYLSSPSNDAAGGIDVTVEAHLRSARMRESGLAPIRVSRASAKSLYWTLAQMVTHHTSGGCNLRSGDLIATGTVSGDDEQSRGCLLEISAGPQPLILPSGEARRFLEDGDELILRGFCEREGYARIGFGECRGVVLPAVEAAPGVN